jgi:hypothetical protein
LISLVPVDCRGEKFPCRHIALNAAGFSIDTYYRLGTHEEVEEAMAAWLRKTIKEVELERDRQCKNDDGAPAARAILGIP